MINLDPQNRLNYKGDLGGLLNLIAKDFELGNIKKVKHLSEGYEDCNIKIDTLSGSYVCKFFADNQLGDYSLTRRSADVADRLVSILNAVKDNGVNTPQLMKNRHDEYLFRSNNLVAMVYVWVDGKSYFDLNKTPTDSELERIIEQATLINTTQLKPIYYHDIWAAPHIEALFAKIKSFLREDDLKLAEEVIQRFRKIDIDKLPKCLVHGDLTKGNVLIDAKGQPSIIDFSVTNWTTRILELVLIVSNLMFDEHCSKSMQEKIDLVVGIYQKYNKLTDVEISALYDLCLVGSAMELLGGRWRQVFMADDLEETKFWINLGRNTLKKELNI